MKKICVVSGSRADYGLLYWTMKRIQEVDGFELQIIATCMHLDPKFGNSSDQFLKDGFFITKKVNLGDLEDSRENVINQISVGVRKFFETYQEIKPDLVIILGDRYEMLAAAQAAVFAAIPIAHIHGGEITEGAFDDIIRHSITKMSTYHFTSTEQYRKRVIQMGEFPGRVLNVGAVGLENIRNLSLITKDDLEKDLGFKFQEKNFLVTYHPVTAVNEDATEQLIQVLAEYRDVGQIITMPNSDPGHEKIFKLFTDYARGKNNVYLSTNLGFVRYLNVMRFSDVVIGNSSSGIIEAPFLGVPTLNIGMRQKGRIRDESVIDCSPLEIKEKLEYIMKKVFKKSDIHGDGFSSSKIINFILKQKLQQKVGFYDL